MSPADETPTAFVVPHSKSAWLVCVQRTAARPTSFVSAAASSPLTPSVESGGVIAPGARMPLSGRGAPSDLDGFLACRPELPEAAERGAGERSPGPADAAGADSF